MATVTYIPESKQSISAMKGLIDYCCQKCKTLDELSGEYLIGGVNVNGKNAFTEFMITKNSYHKTGGMNFYQYVQSFSPNERVTAEQVHKIGLEFAEKAWPEHEVLVTTHTDAEHLHNHFVINSVNYNDGSKLRQNPKTLKVLRDMSDRICIEHGLTVLKPYEKDGAKLSSREYRAASKGESWKFKLISDIDFVMNRCGSREDFIREMNRLGYQITWTDERKYITFTCPNGMKCRDIRLHDEKYLKGVLEYEFTIRQQLAAEQRREYAETEKREDTVRTGTDTLSATSVRYPVEQADRPKAEQFIGGYYNSAELKELLDKTESDPMHIVILLAAYYGLRRSEVLGIKWSAVDFESKTVSVEHKVVQNEDGVYGLDVMKTKSSYHTLPLIPQVEEALQKEKEHQAEMKRVMRRAYNKAYEEYICVDSLGDLIRPNYVTRHFKVILKENGLRNIRFHDLRHPYVKPTTKKFLSFFKFEMAISLRAFLCFALLLSIKEGPQFMPFIW